ncbi:MAG: DUF3426 domain-containing protein [Gammaproteobacteria bacterium]|nr:DUF3426 domain-containing protein [Gammaproteobacteria bacterium]
MSESQPLIAECPSCQTRFRVTEEQLAVAEGRVRCGACLAVFDGREAEVSDDETAIVGDPVDVLLDIERTEEPASGPGSAQEGEFPPQPDYEGAADSIPGKPLHLMRFATAIAAALALLAAGVLVLQYEVYVQDPVLREAYEIVGVEVPRFKALDRIDVANPSVDERLGAPEGLVVRLDLTNTAPRYQRFPSLEVRFQRKDGTLLADEQRVEPGAYLPNPSQSRRMSPNQITPVELRLQDPGPDAFSYSISLL